MGVRLATEGDLPAVEEVYAAAIEVMRGTSLDIRWELGVHPSREGLTSAARAGELLVAEASAAVPCAPAGPSGPAAPAGTPLVGALVVNGVQGAGYEQAPWRVEASSEEVAVAHLLAVAPAARGRGVARELLDAAARLARARGRRALRLDVFVNNSPAYALYLSCGFVDLGVFELLIDDSYCAWAHLMELDLRGDAGRG